MFYSNEVLTSRKYGVATVWLVATIGTKSGQKRVSRKAILDVDVAKACSTVVAPEAPMALRLQSNLLFGIARVYSQQCGYVLTDTETARNNMRLMLHQKHQADMLQPEGAPKARATVLEEDPAFLPDHLDFLNMDLDNLSNLANLNFDTTMLNDESQSTLSPRSSQITSLSQQSIGGLVLPPSASSFPGGPVGGSDLFGVRANSGSGIQTQPRMLERDELFLIEDDGTMNFDDIPARDVRGLSDTASRTGPAVANNRVTGTGLGNSESTANDGFVPLQDFLGSETVAGEIQHETTSETATAPLRRRKKHFKHIVDPNTELGNRVLSERNTNYLANMREACRQKQTSKLAAIAKKNAAHWVLGANSFISMGLRGPLDIFSGARLIEAFTGIDLLAAGRKRVRDDGNDDEQSGRRVRARSQVPSAEVGRGLDEDNFQLMDDDTIEQGREAPTPLDERPASSIYPWNQSAASRRPTDVRTASASVGGAIRSQPNHPIRRGSRLTSASPLIGRGPAISEADEDLHLGLDSDYAMGGMTGHEEFELFGAAAQVDTQTAGQSQWQRATLVGESANFLDFVRTAIGVADEVRAEASMEEEEEKTLRGSVDFDTLLPPHQSQIVAAQAFLHVLTLGSRQLLQVGQEEPFGSISMRIITV